MKQNGLEGKLEVNPLIDEVERSWIAEDFERERKILSEFKLTEIKTEKDIPQLCKDLNSAIRKFKPYKDFVNDLVALRLRCCYGHQDNKQLKRKGRPISELVTNIKRTREYVNSFNIGRGGQVHPAFILSQYPNSRAECDNCREQLLLWSGKFVDKPQEGRSQMVHQWLLGATIGV